MSYIVPNMIVWVDETGSDSRCEGIRKFGYALRGQTPVSFKLGISGKRLSVITAMSSRGVEDIDIIDGTTNGEAFTKFLEHSILPIMQPFNGVNPRSILVLDNASIHHVDKVLKLVNSKGMMIRFMPAYSPDFMPLEEIPDRLFRFYLSVYSYSFDCQSQTVQNLSVLHTQNICVLPFLNYTVILGMPILPVPTLIIDSF